MIRAYRTEIKPTEEQKTRIIQTLGVCRFIYNFYVAENKRLYKEKQALIEELEMTKINYVISQIPVSACQCETTALSTEVFYEPTEQYIKELEDKIASLKSFIGYKDFSKWLNNEYIPNNSDKSWIKDVSSKAVKEALHNANKAFDKFFKGKAGFPNFKKKHGSKNSMYFVNQCNSSKLKDGFVNYNYTVVVERHRIQIPTLGFVRIKEKGYIPCGTKVSSGTIKLEAGRFYISVLVEVDENQVNGKLKKNEPIGIDLGIKETAILSNRIIYPNINKTQRIKKLEKQLRHAQRNLSRKFRQNKNLKKGESTKNIQESILRVQKLYQRLTNIRDDYANKCIAEIIKLDPEYITLEDLNVRGLMKNRYLSKSFANQKLSEFRIKLTNKAPANDIEIRVVSRFYPSSKKCHSCGAIKKDLKLSDRTYICSCGYIEDRDINAALNLRDANKYSIAI